jgi:hypothetical protein
MLVRFRRTGEKSYAVTVEPRSGATQLLDPAPGFDVSIPHDLVHYVVEAELGLQAGVFGRAANGGGTFIAMSEQGSNSRKSMRLRRKQRRRDASLGQMDKDNELSTSERLAGISDLMWRRRQGQRPDPGLWHQAQSLSPQDAQLVARVVARLDTVAPLWRGTPIGGELTFEWPSVVPV